MKIISELQNGNKVTQRNAFLVLAAIVTIAIIVLNQTGVIDLSHLNAR